MMIQRSKRILVVGLGVLGTSYIKAIRYLNLPTEVYMLDNDPKKKEKVYNNTKMVKFFYINDIKKLKNKINLVIISTTANKRFELVKKIEKIKPDSWIIEKLIEQSVNSTNKMFKILKNKKCWINVPRRALREYEKLKLEFNKNKEYPLEISSNLRGDRIVTNLIHLVDILSWFRGVKIKNIDISGLNNFWSESKREGYYDVGGKLIVIMTDFSKIIIKTSKKGNGQIKITNKIKSWTIMQTKKIALNTNGDKIRVCNPQVSIIMIKIIKQILLEKKSKLPTFKDIIFNHNICTKFLKTHWYKCTGKKLKYLPVT